MNEITSLEHVLKDLFEVSGFRICIYDTSFQEIAAYPKQICDFCQLLQENPKAKQNCVQNDIKAFEQVEKEGQVLLYRCHAGLYEAVAPLYYFGVLSGYLMMGQTRDAQDDNFDFIVENARLYTQDKDRMSAAIKKIPVTHREKIMSCIRIMEICAEYITFTNRLHVSGQSLPQEIQRYLYQNFEKELSIDHLCRHFMCSKSTLMSVFKKEYHQTIHQYIMSLRISRAKELLKSSLLPIHTVSQACGFSDQNYFSKVFWKSAGMTPTQYRSRYSSL
jgi:AraC-like DNA-binding protein